MKRLMHIVLRADDKGPSEAGGVLHWSSVITCEDFISCLMHIVLCAGDKGPSEAGGMLQLTLKSLEPPEVPRQQVGL
jgi:hypothetical protein